MLQRDQIDNETLSIRSWSGVSDNYEVEIVKMMAVTSLSYKFSATYWTMTARQPPTLQSSICTAQVVLNASVTHLVATQYMPLTFLYFCLITSKFLYFQPEVRCSVHDQVYLLWHKLMLQRSSIHTQYWICTHFLVYLC